MKEIDWNNFNSSVLVEVTRPEGVFTSTGVAIDPRTVLTTAHSLEGEVLKVRVSFEGCYDPEGYFIKGESFNIHPDYDRNISNYRNDIAKIRLEKSLPKETKFYPLIKRDHDFFGKILRLGFGARGDRNIRTLISPEFRQIRKLEKVLELNDTFSYSGDSGGPVFLQQNGQMYLLAIHSTVSFGPEGKYSFNPLLSPHREWIVAD